MPGIFRPDFRAPPPNHPPLIGALSSQSVPAGHYAITPGPGENLFVGNKGSGVFRLQKRTGVDGSYDAFASGAGLSGDFVLHMTQVASAASGWMGGGFDTTTGQGIGGIDYAFFYNKAGFDTWFIFENGVQITGSAIAGSDAWIWRIGTTLRYGRGANFATAQANVERTVAGVSGTLYPNFNANATGLEWEAEVYDYVALAAYSMAAASAAFALNGSAVSLPRGLRLTAASAAFVLTGKTAGLLAARRLVASSASYSLNGTAVGLKAGYRLVAASAAYTMLGSAITFRVAMPAASASFALNGTAVGLKAGRRLVAATTAYALNGSAAGLLKGRSLAAASAAYALTGKAAGLLASRRMAAASATYTLNGSAVSFLKGRSMAANSAAFFLNGSPLLQAYRLTAASAAYLFTPSAATLNKGRNMGAAGAAYVLGGSNVTLAAHYVLAAQSVAYALSGSPAALARTRSLAAESASYDFFGMPVTLTLVRTVIFNDNAPADAALSVPPMLALAPVTAAVDPLTPPGFEVAAAVSPPQAFTKVAAPNAVELEA